MCIEFERIWAVGHEIIDKIFELLFVTNRNRTTLPVESMETCVRLDSVLRLPET